MAAAFLTPVMALSMAMSTGIVDSNKASYKGLFSSINEQPMATPTRYELVVQYIQSIAAKYPQNAQLIEVGESDSGQKILGLKIGNGSVNHLLVATHHGNEYGSTEVAKGFALSAAETPIKDVTVYVIPVLNIAGYNINSRYEKKNSSPLDPNRNYEGPCGTEGPFTLKSTKALADFVAKNNIVASATLHTYTGAVLYPWGLSTRDLSTPYDQEFIELGKAAAVESGYEVGNSTALLYAADGTYEDYAFLKHGIWSLLFEMGHTHSPNANQVKQLIAENVPGLRRFFEVAPHQRAENHAFTGKCDRNIMKRVVLE